MHLVRLLKLQVAIFNNITNFKKNIPPHAHPYSKFLTSEFEDISKKCRISKKKRNKKGCF